MRILFFCSAATIFLSGAVAGCRLQVAGCSVCCRAFVTATAAVVMPLS